MTDLPLVKGYEQWVKRVSALRVGRDSFDIVFEKAV